VTLRATGREKGGHLKATKTEASAKSLPMYPALNSALLEWKSQSEPDGPGNFVFPSHRHKRRKPLDLAAVLKRKIELAFAKVRIIGVAWHRFRYTIGVILAERLPQRPAGRLQISSTPVEAC
jgi:hypothetical protein